MAGFEGLSTTIAGGAISVALIDVLVENGMLTHEAAKDIVGRAQSKLRPFTMNGDVQEAMRILSAIHQRL